MDIASAKQTMIDNLPKNTGKSLEEWMQILKGINFSKHGEIVKFLKEEHSVTHGYANMLAHHLRGSGSDMVENQDDLIVNQYKGKEHFKPVYDKLITEISRFGNDIDISPKKAYVSLRGKKQFAILQPATKTRFKIGLNLKGEKPVGILEEIKAANSMCSHKINLSSLDEVNTEVLNWVKAAYEKSI